MGLDARLAYRRGVGTYTARLALALAHDRSGVRLTLINAPEPLRKALAGAPVRWAETDASNPVLYEQFRLPALLRREGLDFIHYTDNSGPVLGDAPFVVTMHDAMMTRSLFRTHDGATFRQRMVGLYKHWTATPTARGARIVLTVSEHAKKDLVEKLGVPAGKVRVVPEGVERSAFERPASFRPSHRARMRVLAQGAADKRKNIPGVLRACAYLKAKGVEATFRIIGYPREVFARSGYVALAEKLGVADRVEWAGEVPSQDLAREYWEADVFLYASLWEGFGLPVLEAFAAGTPVVASNVTAIPEVAGNAARLADPTDPEALGEALREVLGRPSLRKTLVGLGAERCRLFTWDRTARETARVYLEAFSGDAS